MTRKMCRDWLVSTHSRPKAAGSEKARALNNTLSFNTQPPEGGWQQQEQGKNLTT